MAAEARSGDITSSQKGPGTTQSVTAGSSSGNRGGVVGGSSTEAPALPSPAAKSTYNREQSSYNPASGTGYIPFQQSKMEDADKKEAATSQQQQPSGGGGVGGGGGGGATTSTSPEEEMGYGIKSTLAGIHGVGESMRGTFNAAIDRAFNDTGVEKNEAITREGEYEIESGRFSPSTEQRETFKNR